MSTTRYRLMLDSALVALDREADAGSSRARKAAAELREELREMEQPPLPTILAGQSDIYDVLAS